jgi:hypothetical protein
MNTVYDAHAAEQIVDILDRGAARQISDLNKHGFCYRKAIFIP